MASKSCKIRSALRLILLLTMILTIISYFTYSHIKYSIFKELSDSNIGITNVRNIVKIIRNIRKTIIITTISVMTTLTPILYKLVSDRFNALNMDYLTEINSRSFYDMKLKGHIKEGKITKRPLSLMMIDVDSFKQINDNYGHDIGDKVLQHVAKILISNTREFDICCRLGGDEFVVILPDANGDQAKLIGQRVINKLKDCEFILDENTMKFINVTLSIGIAEWQNDMNILQFRKCADVALYNSKRNGRNRITEYRRKVNQSNCCFERNSSI